MEGRVNAGWGTSMPMIGGEWAEFGALGRERVPGAALEREMDAVFHDLFSGRYRMSPLDREPVQESSPAGPRPAAPAVYVPALLGAGDAWDMAEPEEAARSALVLGR